MTKRNDWMDRMARTIVDVLDRHPTAIIAQALHAHLNTVQVSGIRIGVQADVDMMWQMAVYAGALACIAAGGDGAQGKEIFLDLAEGAFDSEVPDMLGELVSKIAKEK